MSRALTWLSSTDAPPWAIRAAALALVLSTQTVYFASFWPDPLIVISDNIRYERAGWHLAEGRGMSLTLEDMNDPTVRSWACSRHPDRCVEGGVAPTAIYPPGYGIYIAAIYSVAGRSLPALLISQLLLLWLAFLAFEGLAARMLDRVGYAVAMVIGAAFPYLARQATLVMSDMLHAMLVVVSLWALIVLKPGLRRGILVGALLAAATLVRPYLVLALPALVLVPSVRRGASAGLREMLAAALVAALMFGSWAGRNAIVFGRFIPFSTAGLGLSLIMNKYEWTIGTPFDAPEIRPRFNEALRIREIDPLSWERNRELTQEAVAWMKENPGQVAITIPKRIFRLWVSMGVEARPPLGVLLAAAFSAVLLVLGLWGAWKNRRDAKWAPFFVVIITYWAFLLHTTAEARRTLPLRLFLILLAASALAAFAKPLLARRLRAGG